MRVTFNRFDGWFLKGFDGLRNLLMDRATLDVPASVTLRVAITRLLKAIKSLETIEHESPEAVSDLLLSKVIESLTLVLEERAVEGKIDPVAKVSILNLYHPIRTVLERLKDGNEST